MFIVNLKIMKKTVEDLKIGDIVWSQKGILTPTEWKVTLISETKVLFNRKLEQQREIDRREELTSFNFIARGENKSDYYDLHIFVDEIDAYKQYRKNLQVNLENIYSEQKDFLERITQRSIQIIEVGNLIFKKQTDEKKL